MEFKYEKPVLTIFPEGSIDSTNAESVGTEMAEIRNKNPHDILILDLDALRYISSAGLRQILQLKKQEKDFSIINASTDVYDIFDMTGFTEMMNIKKAFRKISLEGCEVIGEGSNGIVYRYSPDTIVKVYRDQDALDDIQRERDLSRKALILGINTAIPFDTVIADGFYASVFELLNVKSISKHMADDPENIDKYIQILVDLLKEIHGTEVKPGDFPSVKERTVDYCTFLKDKKALPEETSNKLVDMITSMPEDYHLIHGDYHTNNVMYTNGETLLIDMDTLAYGNPVFDFANMANAYHGFGVVDKDKVEKFMKMDWDTCQYILNKTFELYFTGKTPEEIEEIKAKAEIVGYVRLLRRTLRREPVDNTLAQACTKELIEKIAKVDSLSI